MKICTGEFVNNEPGVTDCGLLEVPVNPNVLFDATSTDVTSRSFNVVPGECVQIDAYSLCGATLQIEKLAMQLGQIGVGGDSCCDPDPGTPATVLATKDICGWQLVDCTGPMSICTPGTYRLRLSTPAALGCAFVEMSRQQAQPYRPPAGLVFGNNPA